MGLFKLCVLMFLTVITDKDVTSSCNKLSIIDMPKRYNAFCEKKIYTYNLDMCLFKSLLNTRNYFLILGDSRLVNLHILISQNLNHVI